MTSLIYFLILFITSFIATMYTMNKITKEEELFYYSKGYKMINEFNNPENEFKKSKLDIIPTLLLFIPFINLLISLIEHHFIYDNHEKDFDYNKVMGKIEPLSTLESKIIDESKKYISNFNLSYKLIDRLNELEFIETEYSKIYYEKIADKINILHVEGSAYDKGLLELKNMVEMYTKDPLIIEKETSGFSNKLLTDYINNNENIIKKEKVRKRK